MPGFSPGSEAWNTGGLPEEKAVAQAWSAFPGTSEIGRGARLLAVFTGHFFKDLHVELFVQNDPLQQRRDVGIFYVGGLILVFLIAAFSPAITPRIISGKWTGYWL